MAYSDLREWTQLVEKSGGLIKIDGAKWELEASAICSLTRNMVLFDYFPGYPAGYRVLASYVIRSLNNFFLAVNWSTSLRGTALTKAWKEHLQSYAPVAPRLVDTGPIMENVEKGEGVNLLKFPVPRAFPDEGGRYIGTGHTVIMRDPDTDRVNLGTYRLQLHDKATAGLHISEGKDGRIIMEKYHARGKPCPVVAAVGIDPALFLASVSPLAHPGMDSELEFCGWLKGTPEQYIQGEFTGLPIPARAEIAFEGEILAGDLRAEGPFAEWSGYSQKKDFPVIRVKNLYHRNEPILTVSIGREVHPPGEGELVNNFMHAALVWAQMESAGIREIKGVAVFGTQRLIVVSIKNLYAGHSRQAGLVASQCHAGAYGLAYVIVVDEDIDPANIKDVLWAIACRTEPKRAIQVLDYCWASHLTIQDPAPVQKAEYAMQPHKATYMSKAIIDACKPLEWDPSWHKDVWIDKDLKKQVLEKWGHVLCPP